MRKTKIICTLGPAVAGEGVLRELMLSGMNVARFNFSHGSYEEHGERIGMFKRLREELDLPVAMLLDTKGPEIRIKCFKGNRAELKPNQRFVLTARDVEGDEGIVSVTYADLYKCVSKGERILIDDGLVALSVEDIDSANQDVVCRVIDGGAVCNNKGVNVPDSKIVMPYVSRKDYDDVIFGIQNDFDFIAASFCRSAEDVYEIRKILAENGGESIHIIAKIENNEGVENIDDIIEAADGIMVARGDMGVEIAMEELPYIQKVLIKKCYRAGKIVITATQMLDSMIKNPRPTRAEVTDVANAIYDGTSAIMLSGETAVGKYPVESVHTMSRIARRTEASIHYKKRFLRNEVEELFSTTNAISHATCATAHHLDAKAIVTLTRSGHTARMVSRYRPQCNIIAPTSTRKVYYQLALSWGITPVMQEPQHDMDELFEGVEEIAISTGLVQNGDLVVITGGFPVTSQSKTNLLKVQVLGEVAKPNA